jgi:hypothetical protein
MKENAMSVWNKLLTEEIQIASAFVPVNMATGANAGDRVSLKGYQGVAIVFFKGAGTAGQDPTITLTQYQEASGGASAALNITRVDKKQGADLTAIGMDTVSTSASPATNDTFNANTWTNSTLAEEQALVVIDVKAEDLTEGYDFIGMSVADVGTNAQIGCALYLLYGPRYAASPLPSALA